MNNEHWFILGCFALIFTGIAAAAYHQWRKPEQVVERAPACVVVAHPSGLVSFHPEEPGACAEELAKHNTGCCKIVSQAMQEYAKGVLQ